MPDILLIQPPIRDFYCTRQADDPPRPRLHRFGAHRGGFFWWKSSMHWPLPSPARSSGRPGCPISTITTGSPTSPPSRCSIASGITVSGSNVSAPAAARSGAFLVGISSLFTAYAEEALRTAEAVKARHPRCKIVLGGHHPTELPEHVMECPAVDYVLRGEGEVSMPLLAAALRSGAPLETIPGIVTRTPDGTLNVTEPAVMDRLDDYPLPAVHLVQERFYRRRGRGGAVVVASRGCPMKCSYCSVGASSRSRYRRRSVEAVLGEIESAVRERGAGFIDFEDENIALERSWFLELLEGIRERCGAADIELRAMNGLFPPALDEEVIRSMNDAGFRTLNLSLGATSAEQLRRFRRPDVREAFDRAVLQAERHGLEAVGYIIVGAPGQNPHESLQDLLFLAERRVIAGVSVYYPSPGSVDYEKCRESGILPANTSLMRSTALPLSHRTTREESVTLLRLGRILNFMKSLVEIPGDALDNRQASPEGAIDRVAIGRKLLEAFFRDGIVQGMTPEGEIYPHRTSRQLCEGFIAGVKAPADGASLRPTP